MAQVDVAEGVAGEGLLFCEAGSRITARDAEGVCLRSPRHCYLLAAASRRTLGRKAGVLVRLLRSKRGADRHRGQPFLEMLELVLRGATRWETGILVRNELPEVACAALVHPQLKVVVVLNKSTIAGDLDAFLVLLRSRHGIASLLPRCTPRDVCALRGVLLASTASTRWPLVRAGKVGPGAGWRLLRGVGVLNGDFVLESALLR